MSLKALLVALLVTTTFSVSAQDKIYKNNGDVIPGKVKKVSPRTISYKRQDNPDGPDYTIGRNEVSMIEYENGSKEFMKRGPLPGGRQIPGRDGAPKPPVTSADYGMNIISVSPICINEAGIGIGLAYERMLDKKGKFTFFLPLSYHVGGFRKSYDDDPPVSYLNGFDKQIRILNFNAGVKFYPTGSRGKVRYALGVLFNCQYGQEFEGGSGSVPPYSSYIPPVDKVVMQRAGFLINNSLNLSLTKRFYMGLDVGYGITAINRKEQPYSTILVGQGADALTQFNFRLGYRF
jgi:hypothetical protein